MTYEEVITNIIWWRFFWDSIHT